MLKKLRNEQGFTLLELIIVIVIIAILAVIGFNFLVSAPKRARDARRKSDLKEIKTALETYYTDNTAYPATANYGDLDPDYIKTIPTDPKTSANYSYTSAGSTFVLVATLENPNDAERDAGTGTGGTGDATYTLSNSQ